MVSFSLPAMAQQVTLDDLLKRVEAVEKKNADLQQENADLKAQIQSIQQAQAAQAAAVSAASVPAPAPAKGLNFVTSKLKLNVYGFIMAENVYATNGATTGGNTAYNNVVEYVAPHVTDGKPQKIDKTSAQNSRIGINIAGPDVVGGKTSGQVEMDFNNPTASSSAEMYQPRLRQGWAAIDYDQWGIKAGQTWDFFAPLKTDIVNYSGMWRAGDFGYRHPQAYLTNKWGNILGGKVITQIGIIDSDDIYQQTSGGPVGGAYASYATQIAGKDVTLGLGGIFGTASTSVQNSRGHNNNDIDAGVVTAQVKLADWLSLKGQGYMGAHLTNFMSGPYGQSVVGITDPYNPQYGSSLKTMGGFAEITVKPMEKLQFNLGSGMDDVTNRSAVIATAADQALMYSTNKTYFTNVKYSLTKDLIVGIEYQYLHTNYLDGVIALDNRIDTFMQYNF